MTTISLYRYKRSDGGITISPVKPDGIEYEYRYRLIADEGKVLTDGLNSVFCIDTDTPLVWSETVAPEEVKIE